MYNVCIFDFNIQKNIDEMICYYPTFLNIVLLYFSLVVTVTFHKNSFVFYYQNIKLFYYSSHRTRFVRYFLGMCTNVFPNSDCGHDVYPIFDNYLAFRTFSCHFNALSVLWGHSICCIERPRNDNRSSTRLYFIVITRFKTTQL